MLAPARPQPGEPGYEIQLRRYEEARASRRRHPEDWGFVHPAFPATPPEQEGVADPSSKAPTPIPQSGVTGVVEPHRSGGHRSRKHRR
ncbi:MAG: hypothetical protein OEW39_06300 [Deltaproteobacteria bacterium]|nr:hypothetical protein [Deltaproteobacteria bacterium]